MKRYEGALRRLSILFILVNLLSPLNTSYALAQDATPPSDAPAELQAPPEETVPSPDPALQDPPEQAPPVEPAAPAPVEPVNQPQSEPQPQPQQQEVIQQPAVPVTGGLHIVLLDENRNLLPGGGFTIWDANGARLDVADGGAGDMDYARNGVIVVTDLLAGQVTMYQSKTADWYTFDPNKVILHDDITPITVYGNVSDTRVEVRNNMLDSDLDGVVDRGDNCVAVANGNQLDSDGDGIGDACDETPVIEEPTEVPAALLPVDPVETAAVCNEGVLSAPSLALADTDGVSYAIDPAATDEAPYTGGQIVTITATLVDENRTWGDTLPEGWAIVDGTTTLARSFAFTDVECAGEASLSLTKTAIAVNDAPAEGEIADLVVGDVVTYKIVVTNDGDIDLANVAITDELEGVVWDETEGLIAELSAGESATVQTTYTITEADREAGTVTNVANATATGPDDTIVTAEPASTAVGVAKPSITLTKEAIELKPGDGAVVIGGTPEAGLAQDTEKEETNETTDDVVMERDSADFTSALAGDIVVFELVATNDGKATLNNVVITDELKGIGELVCDRAVPVTLLPGESLRCTAEYTLTDAEISAGTLINTAIATSDEIDAEPVTITVELAPAMMMARDVAPMAANPGDPYAMKDNRPGSGPEYADVILSSSPGSYPGYKESGSNVCWRNNNDGSFVGMLGAGDHPANQTIPDGRASSLGWNGSVTVGFTDNVLIGNGNSSDGAAGGDLMILERGQAAEPTRIEIFGTKPNGQPISKVVGQLTSGSNANTQYFDIDRLLSGDEIGSQFTAVKLTDLRQASYGECSSGRNYAGADIDAVWAISSKIAPSNLIVNQAACVDGTLVNPSLPNGTPQSTSVISYTWNVPNPLVAGSTITGTATLQGAYTWNTSDFPANWTIDSSNNRKANYSRTLDAAPNCAPALSIVKSVNKTSALPGDEIVYTITVTNSGTGKATNVVVKDTLPAGIDWKYNGTSVGSTNFSTTIASIAANNGEAQIQIRGIVPANGSVCGDLKNKAYIDLGTDIFSKEVVTNVTCHPDVKVTKTGNGPIIEGAAMTFTIKVENIGDVTATNVKLSDPLPAGPNLPNRGGHFVWTLGGDGTCTLTGGTGGTLDCSFGDLAPGASKTVTVSSITTIGDANPTAYENTATVSATNEPDGKKDNNTSKATVVVNPLDTGNKTYVCHFTSKNASHLYEKIETPKSQLVPPGNGHGAHSFDVWGPFSIGSSSYPGQNTHLIDLWDDNCVGNPAIELTKTATQPGPYAEGETVTYTFTVENTGNLPLSNVVITDPMTGLVWTPANSNTLGTLAIGDVKTVTATYVVKSADVTNGKVDNTATVNGEYVAPDGRTAKTSDTDDASVTTVSFDLAITKVANKDTGLTLGETVTYTITATNTGTGTLTGVTVADNTAGVIFDITQCTWPGTAGTLAKGQSVSCTATHVITEADILTGKFDNTATADSNQTPEKTAPETVTTETVRRSMTLAKKVNGEEEITVSAPGNVTYTYLVTNTGNVTIDTLVIVDDKISTPIACLATTLAPNGSTTCTVTYNVSQGQINAGADIVNTATATGNDPKDVVVTSNQDTAKVKINQTPGLNIIKATETLPNPMTIGSVITYTFKVTNTGNTTLNNVEIADRFAIGGNGTFTWEAAYPDGKILTLQPGAANAVTVEATYTVTSADLDLGQIRNCAEAIAGTTRSAESCKTVTTDQAPKLELVKKVALAEGGPWSDKVEVTAPATVYWQITVKNTGNVTVSNIVVTDQILTGLGVTLDCPQTTLAQGGSMTCIASLALDQDDINAGEDIVNTAQATGKDPKNTNVPSNTDTATVDIVQTRLVDVAKTSGGIDPGTNGRADAGDKITYTIVVTNRGNVTLSGMEIDDDVTGSITGTGTGTFAWTSPAGFTGTINQSIAPNGTFTIQATYSLTQADINAGATIENCAYVIDVTEKTPTDNCDSDTVGKTPSGDANKSAQLFTGTDGLNAGDQIRYTIVVTNTGNVDLEDYPVEDRITGGSGTFTWTNAAWTPISFGGIVDVTVAQGAVTLYGTYTITQADLNAAIGTTIENCVYLDESERPADCVTNVITGMPALDVAKTSGGINLGDNGRADAGDTIAYTIVVKNAGNTTLSNISVTDAVAGNAPGTGTGAIVVTLGNGDAFSGTIVGPLAPGGSVTLKAIYTLTQADIDAGATIQNCATAQAGTATDRGCDDDTVTRKPGITATKTSRTDFGSSGLSADDTIIYTITVTNTGNTTQKNVALNDVLKVNNVVITDGIDWTSPADFDGTIAELAPGSAAYVITGTYTITQADIDSGSTIQNCIKVEGDIVSSDDCATNPLEGTPDFSIVKTATTTPDPLVVGSTIEYTFTVTNDGNVTLKAVKVTDTPTAPAGMVTWTNGDTIEEIPVGQFRAITATYVVTQADINAGTVQDCATATFGTRVSKPECETVPVTRIADIEIIKTATNVPADGYDVNATVAYSLKVTNTGNVTLENVTVTDDDADVYGLVCPGANPANPNIIPSLEPGAANAITCAASYDIEQADVEAGEYENTARVSGTAPQGVDNPKDNDTETVPTNNTPDIILTKAHGGDNTFVKDQVITYTFTAKNNGKVTLTGVMITDPMPGLSALSCTLNGTTVTNGSVTLKPNEQVICTATYTAQQSDVNRGSIENEADVIAYYGDEEVEDSAEDVINGTRTAGIMMTKEADKTTGVNAGDTITYTYRVWNVGNVTLTDVTITDDKIADDSAIACQGSEDNVIPELAADGITVDCVITVEITQSMIDGFTTDPDSGTWSLTNIGTVTGFTPEGMDPASVTKSDTETISGPREVSINLIKTATLVNGETPEAYPIEHLMLGDVVTYEFVAENTGNVTLADVEIDDPMEGLSALTCDPVAGTSLAPGAKMTCTATYTISQGDLDGRTIVNVATVTGIAPDENEVSDTDDETISGHYEPKLELTKSADITYYDRVGDLITYTSEVENTGNITLTNVQVVDPLDGLSALTCDPVAGSSLVPGGKMTCTATYAVDLDDINGGKVVNTATATSIESDPDSDSAEVPARQYRSISLDKRPNKDADDNVVEGTVITYAFQVWNTGNTTLTNVTVTDPLPGLVWDASDGFIGTLLPNTGKTVYATYTVTAEDVERGYVYNEAIARGEGPGRNPTDEDDETVPVDQTLSFELGKVCPDPALGARVGDTITYQVTVKNDGTVTLYNVAVDDVREGTFNTVFPTTFAPGQSETRTFTTVITADDAENGNLDNTVNVTGNRANGSVANLTASATEVTVDAEGNVSAETTQACAFTPARGLEIEKIASTPVGDDVTAGTVITYTFEVTNTGDVTLDDVVVEDQLEGLTWDAANPNGAVGTLAPGASTTITAIYTVTPDDVEAGSVENCAVATDGTTDSDEDCATVTVDQAPGLTIDKSADKSDEDNVTAGTVVTYSFVVKNTGDVTLKNVTITDDLPGLIWSASYLDGVIGTMLPNTTVTVTATYTVTDEDVEAGNVYNLAIVNGDAPGENEDPTDQDDTNVPVDQDPSLAIVKTASTPDDETVGLGTVITYTFVVTNDGDVTMHNVVVEDQLPGIVWADDSADGIVGTLAPNGSATLTATYVVTQTDVDAGNVHNSAIASGDGPACEAPVNRQAEDAADDCGTSSPPSETDTPIERMPSINLVKTAILVNGEEPVAYPIEHLMFGDTVTYEMIATNTGNVTLTNVTILDPMEGLSALECDPAMPAEFAPGESITCLATLVISQQNLDGRYVDNEATVTGIAPDENTVSDSDTERLTGRFEPILVLEKTAATPEGEVVTAGTVITYSFTVTNTGNITINDVVVNDPLAGLVWNEANADGMVGTLGAGEAATITATYTVTAADVEAGNVHNAAIANGQTEFCLEDNCGITSNPAEVDVPVAQAPGLTIVKTAAPEKVAKAGEQVTYTFVVTNHGDVTMDDIVVDDQMLIAAGIKVPTIGTLAPGESATVTAIYTVTADDVTAGKVVNVATATNGETTSPPDEATVTVVMPDAPAAPDPVTPPAPAAAPESPVKGLPVTGSGDTSMAPGNAAWSGLWIVAASSALMLFATACGVRRQAARR